MEISARIHNVTNKQYQGSESDTEKVGYYCMITIKQLLPTVSKKDLAKKLVSLMLNMNRYQL